MIVVSLDENNRILTTDSKTSASDIPDYHMASLELFQEFIDFMFMRFFTDESTRICPFCRDRLYSHGTVQRKIYAPWDPELTIEITIHRVCCRKCKKTHRILPSFIVPYQYLTAIDCAQVFFSLAASRPIDLKSSQISPQANARSLYHLLKCLREEVLPKLKTEFIADFIRAMREAKRRKTAGFSDFIQNLVDGPQGGLAYRKTQVFLPSLRIPRIQNL